MAAWSVRSAGYKLGVAILCVGALTYVTGFATPHWVDTSQGDTTYSQGLWMDCTFARVASQCSGVGSNMKYVPDWVKAIQGLQCIGCIAMLAALVYHVVIDCCMSAPLRRHLGEALAILGGVTAFIGAMLYVDHTLPYVSQFYSWSFGLDIAGCLLVIAGAILILKNNTPITEQASAATAVSLSQIYAHMEADTSQQSNPQHTPPTQRSLPPPSSSDLKSRDPVAHSVGCVTVPTGAVSDTRHPPRGSTPPPSYADVQFAERVGHMSYGCPNSRDSCNVQALTQDTAGQKSENSSLMT